MSNYVMVCPKCGSDNVERDAWAYWDEKAQKYEVGGVRDASECLSCGWDGNGLEQIDLDTLPTSKSEAREAMIRAASAKPVEQRSLAEKYVIHRRLAEAGL